MTSTAQGVRKKISDEGWPKTEKNVLARGMNNRIQIIQQARRKEFRVHDSSFRAQNATLFSIVMMVSTVYNGVCSKFAFFPLSSVLRVVAWWGSPLAWGTFYRGILCGPSWGRSKPNWCFGTLHTGTLWPAVEGQATVYGVYQCNRLRAIGVCIQKARRRPRQPGECFAATASAPVEGRR